MAILLFTLPHAIPDLFLCLRCFLKTFLKAPKSTAGIRNSPYDCYALIALCVIALEMVTGDTFEILMPGVKGWSGTFCHFFPFIVILCVCVLLHRIALAKKSHANVPLKRTSL